MLVVVALSSIAGVTLFKTNACTEDRGPSSPYIVSKTLEFGGVNVTHKYIILCHTRGYIYAHMGDEGVAANNLINPVLACGD